jgi:hypothetical protein
MTGMRIASDILRRCEFFCSDLRNRGAKGLRPLLPMNLYRVLAAAMKCDGKGPSRRIFVVVN